MSRWVPLLAVAVVLACVRNPATGERQLALVSESQEIALGRQAAQEAVESIGLVDAAALQDYVNRVGTSLAAASERPDLPWSFGVVDDPTPNAFALPGGFIFVTRGLMNLMTSEAELATVLGHEIGHVTARHSVTQISRQQLAQLGLGLGGVFFPDIQPFSQALGAGLQLLFLRYGRDAERQADQLGFEYARAGGYDVSQMADVFAALQRAGEREDSSALPSWLATHPAPAERIEAVQQRLAALGPQPNDVKLGRTEYLSEIDGLVYGENPRNGFFRDGVFYHPELRFRFAVPNGWQQRNTARAVVAASPQGDAVIQLTLAGDVTPEQATQRFLSQTGVRGLPSSRQSFSGIPAVVTRFQAQTQQVTLGGYVAYLAYRDHTYQLLGYTADQAFASWEPVLAQAVASFAPLTDPAILAVQPQHIDIVKVPRRLSLREYADSYSSAVDVDTLALINQLEGPASIVPAGTLLKRVVAVQ